MEFQYAESRACSRENRNLRRYRDRRAYTPVNARHVNDVQEHWLSKYARLSNARPCVPSLTVLRQPTKTDGFHRVLWVRRDLGSGRSDTDARTHSYTAADEFAHRRLAPCIALLPHHPTGSLRHRSYAAAAIVPEPDRSR
jgi:hypothetical protein